MTRKPKTNYKTSTHVSNSKDRCQTPPYALNPLLPYLPAGAHIWEPAAGEGILVEALQKLGYTVTATEILRGQNFFTTEAPPGVEFHVTNPPFGPKYDWLDRCYDMGIPFALLLPVEVLGAQQAQNAFEAHGVELIVYDQRVDFKMPDADWDGAGAQFPTMWVTWGLKIGRQITFAKLNKPSKQERDLFALGMSQLTLF